MADNTLTASGLKAMADAMAYGGLTASPQPKPNKFTERNMSALINMRMGWNLPGAVCPFDTIKPYKLNPDQAVVFIIHDGRALTINDDLALFPSDTLVTQLRLLTD